MLHIAGGFSGMRGTKNIARKPFNPVHGEIHRCFWTPDKDNFLTSSVLDDKIKPTKLAKVQDKENLPYFTNGMIFCDDGEVSFLGEQVSHHPPISAFYAECKGSNISFNGSFELTWSLNTGFPWSLLKSVVVKHPGAMFMTCHSFKERYEMVLPNVETFHPLTNPVLQLSGEVDIVCKSTNCKAKINFSPPNQDKSSINSVKAEIYDLARQKSPIVVIEGSWSARMFITMVLGKKVKIPFLDISAYKKERGKCLPLDQMVTFTPSRSALEQKIC